MSPIIHRLFAAGIEKCPNHVSLYQAWSCLELRDGDVITAKRLISEALTRDKRNGSGWLVAAQIEEKMGNHGLVGLILRRGIECAPGDMELYRALAEHEISRGKIDSVSRRAVLMMTACIPSVFASCSPTCYFLSIALTGLKLYIRLENY